MYIILIIPLFSFNFIHCFKSREYLEESFTEIRNKEESIYNINADACQDMENNVIKKFQICQRVFRLLRDDVSTGNPYTHSISMNYKAFEQYPVCQERSVWIRLQPAVKLMSLNCYGQPSILYSDTSPDTSNNKYLNEISVFRGIDNTLIVTKCRRVDSCEVIELYNSIQWQQYSSIPLDVSSVLVPRTATIDKLRSAFFENLREVKRMSFQRGHLMGVYLADIRGFGYLCDLIIKRSKYLVKCDAKVFKNYTQRHLHCPDTVVMVFQQFITTEESHIAIDLLRKEEWKFPAFNCSRYKRSSYSNTTFKIMSGPDNNSVILLEPLSVEEGGKFRKIWLPVELIENLHWVYVLNFNDWF